jgi:hypothetical protein
MWQVCCNAAAEGCLAALHPRFIHRDFRQAMLWKQQAAAAALATA